MSNQMKQRTRAEGLQAILDYAKKNRFASGQYRSDDGKRRCVVGCMLTTKQLNDIIKRNLNEDGIKKVAKVIGSDNLTFMTGMSVFELGELQAINDDGAFKHLTDLVAARLSRLKEHHAKA